MVSWLIVHSTSAPRTNEGNVRCFGEHAKDYENGKVTTTKASWEATKEWTPSTTSR